MSMVDYTRDTMKNGLIEFGESHKTMSSLEIAEVIGKPHNDIMKAIRKMEPAWEKVAQGKFSHGTYQDKNNQARPCYNLTYRETLFVASKFKDEERARLILRWESLETGQAQPMFQQPKFGQIRTAGTADNPLFCLSDICKVLDLQPGATKNRLGAKGISFVNTHTSGGNQQLVYINEQNLYKVIMRSNKQQAESFQDWVCCEVLPSIRKTGSYSIQNLSRKELALMVIQAEEENERLALENKQQAATIEEQKPKVVFADAIVGSQSGCKSIR